MSPADLKCHELYEASRMANYLEGHLVAGIKRAVEKGYTPKEIADAVSDILTPLESLAINWEAYSAMHDLFNNSKGKDNDQGRNE